MFCVDSRVQDAKRVQKVAFEVKLCWAALPSSFTRGAVLCFSEGGGALWTAEGIEEEEWAGWEAHGGENGVLVFDEVRCEA